MHGRRPQGTEWGMAILTEDMQRVIGEQRLGFYATVSEDGSPNLSPKGTTYVWDDDHIFFADIRSPQTVANIRRGSLVELNVVDPLVRKGYRFKGPAVVHEQGTDAYEEGLERLRRAGSTAGDRVKAIVAGGPATPVPRLRRRRHHRDRNATPVPRPVRRLGRRLAASDAATETRPTATRSTRARRLGGHRAWVVGAVVAASGSELSVLSAAVRRPAASRNSRNVIDDSGWLLRPSDMSSPYG